MAASSLTLADFENRVRAFLQDTDKMSYTDATLDESLRQAIGDLGRAYGAFVTIEDLDGAAATNVEGVDEALVVRGAAGFAARARAVDRAENANLGQAMPSGLLDWSKNTLYYFDQKLVDVKRRILQQSTSGPADAWEWDESTRNW